MNNEPCPKIMFFIINGTETSLQAEKIYQHILKCENCAKFKAKLLNINVDEILQNEKIDGL